MMLAKILRSEHAQHVESKRSHTTASKSENNSVVRSSVDHSPTTHLIKTEKGIENIHFVLYNIE